MLLYLYKNTSCLWLSIMFSKLIYASIATSNKGQFLPHIIAISLQKEKTRLFLQTKRAPIDFRAPFKCKMHFLAFVSLCMTQHNNGFSRIFMHADRKKKRIKVFIILNHFWKRYLFEIKFIPICRLRAVKFFPSHHTKIRRRSYSRLSLQMLFQWRFKPNTTYAYYTSALADCATER